MVISGKVYTPQNYHKTLRVKLAASYSGASLEYQDYCPGNPLPTEVKQCPDDVAPLFHANDGTVLFEANAIAYYVGNKQLRGGDEEAFVTQWNNFTDQVLLPSVASWYYPTLGATAYNKAQVSKGRDNVYKILHNFNKYLETKTYFVGDRITQADLTIFTVLKMAFENLMDEASRDNYAHVMRWFITIANQPEVKKVAGEIHLCEKPLVYDRKTVSKAEEHKGGEKKKEKHQQKNQESSKSESAKAAEGDTKEEKPKEKEKTTKDILSALPVSSFVFDDFKRVFSNEPPEKAMEYLEEHYDPNIDSIWTCEYKYGNELTLTFMTTNLVRGMMQRLDAMRKWAFGIVSVVGVDSNNNIVGLWIWRGTGLIFELSEDLNSDYDCYTWKKLELNLPEDKALVATFFARGETFEGREVADCIVFK